MLAAMKQFFDASACNDSASARSSVEMVTTGRRVTDSKRPPSPSVRTTPVASSS